MLNLELSIPAPNIMDQKSSPREFLSFYVLNDKLPLATFRQRTDDNQVYLFSSKEHRQGL